MRDLFDKMTSLPLAAQLLVSVNIGALLFVLIMQFGFGLNPCILCLWQRVPYGLAAILCLLILMGPPSQARPLLLVCTLIYIVGTGLAVFHTGVERHWWHGTASCGVEPLHADTPDDLRNLLLHSEVARCDEISWSLFGLSMTNYNVALSLGVAVFTGIVCGRASARK